MSMEINQLSSSDFGSYRCSISDNFGAAATEVQLTVASLTTASSTPPDTPIECCKGRGVENRCLSMCGGVAENTDIKRFSPRPFMPFNCSTQISKVLSCAMPGIDDSECCLRRNVPRSCIYLCDSSVVPENHMDPLCLQYTLSVENCRVGGVDQRPSSVLGLKAQSNVGANSIAIQWDASTSAEIYHVYWRRNRNSDWQQKSSVGTSKKIQGGAEEIVLVAANVYGISQASRLTLNNSKWIPS
ncbi:Ig-like and fibronectin type-III domain-containing protein C25G4.10 [Aphelenchoides bicaudatus]|nr:Ig-like and fibronectin type-III domain-containing protein C25G4.10 [Aphelenchoides bicaudatus]